MQSFADPETARTAHGPDPTPPDPALPDPALPDPALMVSMFDDHLVINVPPVLNFEMTEVLVAAAASAVASGAAVMLDLDPDTTSDELVARSPSRVAASTCAIGEGRPVSVLGAGFVRLATNDAYWTIDLAQGRLCRSDVPVEPHFVGLDGWTPIQAFWATPMGVSALTYAGTYLSASAAWTTQPRSQPTSPTA